MQNVKQMLEKFFSTPWRRPTDTQLMNQLMKYKNEMLRDHNAAIEYFNQFAEENATLVTETSNEFQQAFDDICNATTGDPLMEQIYHGYWDDTSLIIQDKRKHKIAQTVMTALRKMAMEYYGIRLMTPEDDKMKPFALIVPKIAMDKAVAFREDVAKVDSHVTCSTYIHPKKNFNIADKINKANRAAGITENTQLMIFEKAKALLNEHNIGFNVNALRHFEKMNNETLVEMVESGSEIDAHRLGALLEFTVIREMDTSDMTVFDTTIGTLPRRQKEAKDRLDSFDPYANIGNAAPGSHSVMRRGADMFKEVFENVNLDKMVVIESDVISTENKSRIVVESNGKHMNIAIDKNDFLEFVCEAAHVKDGNAYLKMRPFTFQTILFKEYFKSKAPIVEAPKVFNIKEARQVNDYNQWKSSVATATNNEFEIKSKGRGTVEVTAVDATGDVVGTWNSDKCAGYVRK